MFVFVINHVICEKEVEALSQVGCRSSTHRCGHGQSYTGKEGCIFERGHGRSHHTHSG